MWAFAVQAGTNSTQLPPEMENKIFVGYQGWFRTPTDGSGRGWFHWGSGTMSSTQLTVDMWPDVTEYPSSALSTLPAGGVTMLGNGSPTQLFSSVYKGTTDLHLKWMQNYGVDGAFIQRFVTDLKTKNNEVPLLNMVASADRFGQKVMVMYDISSAWKNSSCYVNGGTPDASLGAANPNFSINACIRADWTALQAKGLTNSNGYMKVYGSKPVVGIWGFGFNPGVAVADGSQYITNTSDAWDLINWFKTQGIVVMGGVPANWRTRTGDALSGASWTTVYNAFNIISPWLVGRFSTSAEINSFVNNVYKGDISAVQATGQGYLPVIYPGFSFFNTARVRGSYAPLNQIHRYKGTFYWDQFTAFKSLGLNAMYVAMFDEVDEGTAIFKVAPSVQTTPQGTSMVTLDADGTSLPSDWYLNVTNHMARLLKGGNISFPRGFQLTPGQIGSGAGVFLVYQNNGDLVVMDLFNNIKWAASWSTPSVIRNCAGGCRMSFQSDGNLVLFDNGNSYWSSNTSFSQLGGYQMTQLVLSTDSPYLSIKDASANTWWTPVGGVKLVGNTDVIPPSISIVSPAPNLTYTTSQTVPLTATASDNVGVVSVIFKRNGVTVATDADAPYLYNWPVTAAANGVYTWTATAVDAAGNNATVSVPVTVNIGGTAPTISLTAPAGNTNYTSAQTVAITANAADSAGIEKVWFIRNGITMSTDTVAPYAYNWNMTSSFNGNQTWTARAFSTTGASTTSAGVLVTVNIDGEAPAVALTSPLPNTAYTSPQNVSINATATDNVGVTKVWFLRNGVVVATDTTAPYTFTWPIGSADNGTYTWTARAFDAAGNSKTTANLTLTVNVEGGTTFPSTTRPPLSPPNPAPAPLAIGANATRIPSDLQGKIFVNYQGWYRTPTDGSGQGWAHWGTGNLSANQLAVDMWPDVADYPSTSLSALPSGGVSVLGDGTSARLFSSVFKETTDLHLKWMQNNGIDGAFVQRVVADMAQPKNADPLIHLAAGAESFGQKIVVVYDVSGAWKNPACYVKGGVPDAAKGSANPAFSINRCIRADWADLLNQGLTAGNGYLKVNGSAPLVGLKGFGLNTGVAGNNGSDTIYNTADGLALIQWFQNQGIMVLGVTPTYWRTQSVDSLSDIYTLPKAWPTWTQIYGAFNIISPQMVGRVSTSADVDQFTTATLTADVGAAQASGQGYLPIIYPGYSASNLSKSLGATSPLNQIKRYYGTFYWKQFNAFRFLGLNAMTVAAFDGMDDGTALLKMAPTAQTTPKGVPLVTLDLEGFVPSDWYLFVTKNMSKILKGGDLSLPRGFQLTPGQRAEAGGVTLVYQSNGDLVVYDTFNGVPWAASWATPSVLRNCNSGCKMVFQTDGNLVLYDNGVAYWTSKTSVSQLGGYTMTQLVLSPNYPYLFIKDASANTWWTPVGGVKLIGNTDVVPPSVSFISPADRTTYAAPQTIPMTATAMDNAGVASVTFKRNGVTMATVNAAPYTYTWAVTSVNQGTHTWTATAMDASGNSATTSVTVFVSNISGLSSLSPQAYSPQVPTTVDNARAYPSPLRPNRGVGEMTFDTLPAATAVRIFTMDGRSVTTLHSNSEGKAFWNLQNEEGNPVASGVYLVLIEKNGTKKQLKVVIQK